MATNGLLKALESRRSLTDMPENRLMSYLEQVCKTDGDAEHQLRVTSKRDSIEESVVGDLFGLAHKLREHAKFRKDADVGGMSLTAIVKWLKHIRSHYYLDARGNRDFIAAIARVEQAKGLNQTHGNA